MRAIPLSQFFASPDSANSSSDGNTSGDSSSNTANYSSEENTSSDSSSEENTTGDSDDNNNTFTSSSSSPPPKLPVLLDIHKPQTSGLVIPKVWFQVLVTEIVRDCQVCTWDPQTVIANVVPL